MRSSSFPLDIPLYLHFNCTMSFAFRRQPFNAIYTVYVVAYILAALLVWILRYAVPASRPRKSWTMMRVIIGRVVRTWIDMLWQTSLPPPVPLPERERDVKSFGFI